MPNYMDNGHRVREIKLALQRDEALSLSDAQHLAQYARSDYECQMAAGRTFLFGSGQTVSIVVEAERCFRRALDLEPDNIEALTYVGFSLDNQGRWTEAKEIYEHVLQVAPTFELARSRYAAALEELNIVDQDGARIKRSPFTRFPETLASVSNIERAIENYVLSHVVPDALQIT